MKSQTILIIVLFTVIFIFLSTDRLYAQILSELDYTKLDTMLFKHKYKEIKAFLDAKNDDLLKYKLTGQDSSDFLFFKNRYLKFLKNFKRIEFYNTKEIEKRIKHFLKYQEMYVAKDVGQRAENYYLKFLEYNRVGNNILALKNYNLAFFYKNFFVHKKKNEVTIIFELMEDYLNKQDFDAAKILAEKINFEYAHLFKIKAIKSRYETLSFLINEGINQTNFQKRLYQQEYQTDFKFLISAGAQFIPYSSDVNENQSWFFYSLTRHNTYNYDIDKVELNYSYGFLLDFAYYPGSYLKLSSLFEYGNNNSNSITQIGQFSNGFNSKYWAAQVIVDYLFRKNIGLRPYAGLGFKYLDIKREKLVNSDAFITIFNVISDAKNYNVTQILLNFGTEYIYSENSNVVYQVFTTLYFNTVKSKIIGPFGINVGIKAGYAL